MSHDDVVELERLVRDDPDDLVPFLLLIGYFSYNCQSDEDRTRWCDLIVAVIDRAPELMVVGSPFFFISPGEGEVYARAKTLWLSKVSADANNASLLRNAARFFAVPEPDLSENLVSKGKMIDPKAPEWATLLAHLQDLRKLKSRPIQP